MVEVWFESHATTLDNEAKIASGWKDIDLSAKGLQQAQALIERVHSRKIDTIFCSDLQRAFKTAVPSAGALNIPVYVDKRLRECDYGDYEGHPSAEIESQRIHRIDAPFPNGESYRDCMQRMEEFCADVLHDFDGRTVLVIGHRATQYGLEVFADGKDLRACITEQWHWQPGWKYRLQSIG